MRCGDEKLHASFIPERARLEFSDGTQIELPNMKQGGDPDQTRVYTNGRLILVRTSNGLSTGVTFARGRMLPVKCDFAQN